jgi:L-threonylcarbamoyladenylate synthase
MTVRGVRLSSFALQPSDLEPAVSWIRRGLVVAYPTETFYGLAVNPTDPAAVQALFALKGRDPRMAIPLIASTVGDVEALCSPLTGASAQLARAFWPGPLSLVLDAPPSLPPGVHGGAGTVAIRVPSHPLARALAAACGHVITATSANRSGEPPVARATDLGPIVNDARVFVIDGGATEGGAPSTIVDARNVPPTLVRAGAIAWDRVLESLEK